jgi:hypothetical protein
MTKNTSGPSDPVALSASSRAGPLRSSEVLPANSSTGHDTSGTISNWATTPATSADRHIDGPQAHRVVPHPTSTEPGRHHDGHAEEPRPEPDVGDGDDRERRIGVRLVACDAQHQRPHHGAEEERRYEAPDGVGDAPRWGGRRRVRRSVDGGGHGAGSLSAAEGPGAVGPQVSKPARSTQPGGRRDPIPAVGGCGPRGDRRGRGSSDAPPG